MDPSSWFGAGGDSSVRVLQEDGERVFCRAWRESDNGERTAVLAVVPASERPTPAILDRLAHECGLKDELDGAWAVQPRELVREDGRIMLVLEDPGGEPLDRLLGAPMEVASFLRLAIGIAATLGKVHQHGLVHKDIKPSHILVNCADGQVRLTGFGLASRLPRERQAPEPPEFIAGTLAYMAPEQTGRMNRSIDSRSDLYALGVTLYQMLTSSLPFTASDPMEWVHCHIARQPLAPGERSETVPAPISQIVMKLLAKTAEERYQSATGVENDLRHCLDEWEREGRIAPFALGGHDAPDRLLIPEKLYGRGREVDTLLAAFDRVVNSGAPELVLVSGYSGIGKSSVVHELHKMLVPPRGLFASGKFDQYKRDIPYSTLAQAFQGLVRPLLSKSEAELNGWRDALLRALDPNGQLMVDLVPDLTLVIGDQPPVPELPPQQAQSRFQLVFRRFIGVFARADHPLALFLDDLQWLDAATLDLLEDLLTRSDLRHLMLIGAYRDNEVDAAHPLTRKLQAIRNAGAKIEEITLAPLACEHLGQLIADALRGAPRRAAPLARLVHDKTAGNPFFAIQFISALADEGLLCFDHRAARWSWNLDRIHAKGYTDNVVDLMIGKLARLSAETQTAVQQLACVGNAAEIAMLSIAFGTSEEQVHADLWEAVRLELVERQKGSYKFVHDRVQEAAYSLIPEASRAPAHLRIGRLLAAQTPPEKRQETIFEIVNQLNRGAALIAARDEREQLAELNLIAGNRAKTSTAYASACAYLRTGMAALGREGWTSRHELAFGLCLERAECEYLSGDFDEAERLITELLTRGGSKIDKAAAYRLKIDLHVLKSENPQAVESALECLSLFGIEMPPHPAREQVDAEYEKVWSGLGGRPIESLIDLPQMTDPDMRAAMRVLSVLFAPAYFTDINLVCLHLCHMVNMTLRYGTTDASAHAYAWFGVILGPVFNRYTDGYRFGRLACDLVEKYDLVAYKAKTYFSMEMMTLWTQPVQAAIDCIRTAFRAGVETGDVTIACYSCNHTVTDLLTRGDHLDEAWQETERGLDFARKAKFRDVVDIIVSQQQFIRNMRGQTGHFSTFSDTMFDEDAFEAQLTEDRMATMVCWYWILKVQARFMSGDYETALAAARKAKALLWSSDAHIQLLDYHYYTALAIASAYATMPPDRQREAREDLTAHLRQLQEWAEACSAVFRDKRALVAAESARLDGRQLDAMRLYEEAIRLARENGFVENEGIANELAARFYAACGFETIADAYLRNARYCYLRWGATGKVLQLDEMHPHLRKEEPARGPTVTIGAPVEHLELATVIKLSQAISGTIVRERLLDTLMRTAIAQAGAERGVLVLSRGAAPRIEAEATTGGDTVAVELHDEPVTAAVLPEAVLQYVLRTKQSVILDDAAAQTPFAADPYIRERQARSILCLPLVTQARVTGVLYLENNLAPRAFAPARIAVLKLLASQAAIALENASLYRDLAEREAKIRRLVDSNVIGIFFWDFDGRILEANDAFLRMVGHDREDLMSGHIRWTELTPPEWRDRDVVRIQKQKVTGRSPPFEKEYYRKDGSRVPVLIGAANFEEGGSQGVAFVLDLTERKRVEQELRYHMQLLKTVTDNAPSMLYIVDAVARGTFVNPSFERMTGYRPEEVIGQVVHDKIHHTKPDGTPYPVHECPLMGALRDRRVLRGEDVFVRKDGTFFPVRYTASPIFHDGVAVGTAVEVQDLTEGKAAEAELRNQAKLLNLAHDAIIVRAPEGRIAFWNQGAVKTYGWTAEEAIGRVSHELLQTRFPVSLQAVEVALQEQGEWEGELAHITRHGTAIVVTSRQSLQRNAYGSAQTVLEINRDITERKRAEQELRASEERFRTLVQFSFDAYWETDAQHRFVRQEFAHGVADSPAEGTEIGKTRWDVPNIEPDAEAWRRHRETLDAHLPFRDFELARPTSDGGKRYVSVSGLPMFDESGRFIGYRGVGRHITERKQAEQALHQAQAELAHANRVATMGQLTGSIAHEINQPIAAMAASGHAALRWLAGETPDLEAARRSIERVIRDAGRAGSIIGRTRDLIKKAPQRKDRVDINGAIREVIELTRSEAIKHGISVQTQLVEGVPLIEADRVELQQVILNLVINAIEAMSEASEGVREVLVTTGQAESGSVLVAVRDSGPGLAPTAQERVFEAFYTTKPGGLGMGLSICRSIIEAHGGRLWVEANVPRGAVFQFTIPAYPDSAP